MPRLLAVLILVAAAAAGVVLLIAATFLAAVFAIEGEYLYAALSAVPAVLAVRLIAHVADPPVLP